MNNQNLIIYEFDELYKILNEIKKDININFEKASINQISDLNLRSDVLILTKKKIQGLNNQLIFDKFPVRIFKLIEKIYILQVTLQNKKILITGGAGFIGYHLALALAKKNKVTILDNFLRGKKDIYLNLDILIP